MTNETNSKTNKLDEGKPVLKFETRPYDESLSEIENVKRLFEDIDLEALKYAMENGIEGTLKSFAGIFKQTITSLVLASIKKDKKALEKLTVSEWDYPFNHDFMVTHIAFVNTNEEMYRDQLGNELTDKLLNTAELVEEIDNKLREINNPIYSKSSNNNLFIEEQDTETGLVSLRLNAEEIKKELVKSYKEEEIEPLINVIGDGKKDEITASWCSVVALDNLGFTEEIKETIELIKQPLEILPSNVFNITNNDEMLLTSSLYNVHIPNALDVILDDREYKGKTRNSPEQFSITGIKTSILRYTSMKYGNEEVLSLIASTVGSLLHKAENYPQYIRNGKIWFPVRKIAGEIQKRPGTKNKKLNEKEITIEVINAGIEVLQGLVIKGNDRNGKTLVSGAIFEGAEYRRKAIFNGKEYKHVWGFSCKTKHNPLEYPKSQNQILKVPKLKTSSSNLGIQGIDNKIGKKISHARSVLYNKNKKKTVVELKVKWEDLAKLLIENDGREPISRDIDKAIKLSREVLEERAKLEAQKSNGEASKDKPVYIKAYIEYDKSQGGRGKGKRNYLVLECHRDTIVPKIDLP